MGDKLMAERPDIYDAILAINPNAVCRCDGDEVYENFTWQDGTTPISKEDIQTKLNELQAEYDAQDYARKRKAEYPDIYDYMDGIVKNDQTQIDKYIADAQAVKSRHPKGG
jgi:hypothetical protein